MVCLGFGKLGGEVWVPRSKWDAGSFSYKCFFPASVMPKAPKYPLYVVFFSLKLHSPIELRLRLSFSGFWGT